MAKMPQPRDLALISKARRALEAATNLDEVKEVRDKAAAIQRYLKTAGESLAAQNSAAELKLRAERKGGELLAGMEKRAGARDGKTGLHDETPLLADIGLDKTQSHRWQRIASVPEVEFEAYLTDTVAAGKELTSIGAIRLARLQENAAVRAGWEAPSGECAAVSDWGDLAGQRFGTIYADPPWQYSNQSTRAATDNHYHTLTVPVPRKESGRSESEFRNEHCCKPVAD